MTEPAAGAAFVAAAAAGLSTSWLLVSRLEKVGERIGLSEALLGMVAALAADGPEITAAVTAIVHHQQRVGAGIILGSCVFNLAALLGLGAVVAGRIDLHRRVIVLGGTVAAWIAASALITVRADVVPGSGLGLAVLVLAGYAGLLGSRPGSRRRLPLPGRAASWLEEAVAEEEAELEGAIRPAAGTGRDALVAALALVVVVVTSVVMERSATSLGRSLSVPDIVVGALVLGGVTGMPNAVASTYLARRGRGAAALSTALNSNNFNIVIGLLVPATAVGLGGRSGQTELLADWAAALTVVTLALAFRDRGLKRWAGMAILAAYAAFVASVIAAGLA